MIKLLFFGTQEWAAELLDVLLKDDSFEVSAVITQADSTFPTPVKRQALAAHLPILQPDSLKDPEFLQTLESFQADVSLVIAYGRLLPSAVISVTSFGTLNVHPSLLPKWRGPSPIQTAIKEGDSVSGVTIMRIDELMDHGPILAQESMGMAVDETPASFTKKVVDMSRKILPETIKSFVSGKIVLQEQDHSRATLCKMLTREDGHIRPEYSALQVERMVRAYHPWPGAWMLFMHNAKEKRLKILEGRISAQTSRYESGHLFENEGALCLTTSLGVYELTSVQVEGKSPMPARAFLTGYRDVLASQ